MHTCNKFVPFSCSGKCISLSIQYSMCAVRVPSVFRHRRANPSHSIFFISIFFLLPFILRLVRVRVSSNRINHSLVHAVAMAATMAAPLPFSHAHGTSNLFYYRTNNTDTHTRGRYRLHRSHHVQVSRRNSRQHIGVDGCVYF